MGLFHRDRQDRELGEEIESFLELRAAEKVRQGMSPEAARREAKLEMEGTDHVKEAVRDVRGGATIERILRDIRFGLRTLRRSPAFTAFTILTFALAIGGLTTIFSLVNAVLLKPLPYPESDRLVSLMEDYRNTPTGGFPVAAPNFRDWELQAGSFEAMAMWESTGFNLSGDGEPEQVPGLRTTHKLFDVLGVRPMLGRGLVAADDEGTNGRVVVISWGLWQRRFGGDPAIIGRAIRMNQEPWQVVGVMPRGFAFPRSRHAVWTPIALTEADQGRGSHSFFTVARLRDGVAFEQAREEMRTIGVRLAAEYPESSNDETVHSVRLRDQWMGQARSILVALLVAVGLVVLIAASNIASLLVARGHARRRELAARMALGGSRGRLVSQILAESVLLAAGGAIVGLSLATAGIRALVSVLPPGMRYVPYRDLTSVSVDFTVFAVIAAVALLAGIAAGLAPALTVLPAEPAEVLRDGEGRGSTSRGGRRLKQGLVSVEVGLAVVVLVSAALLITSIRKLVGVAPGLDPVNVVAMDMSLPQEDAYGPAKRIQYCDQVTTQVGSVAGVTSASAVSLLPLRGGGASRSFRIEGDPDPGTRPPWGQFGVTCPGYFGTMGIPLQGRDFTADDRATTGGVVIINEAMRDRYFRDRNPIGMRITQGSIDDPASWKTIIGVAGNVRHFGLGGEIPPYLYAPYPQAAWPSMTIVARLATGGSGTARPIREAISRFEPEAPVGDPQRMEQVVDDSLGHIRFPLILFSIFAALATALAATGIFGIASQSVQQRRRELGIRRALGAGSRQLYGLVVGQTMVPVGIGVGLGLIGALAGTRVIGSLLYGIGPTNLPTFGVVAVVLCLVAIGACLVPARRAAHVDPAVVLREDG
jgi:putative ABC transport system permease protein